MVGSKDLNDIDSFDIFFCIISPLIVLFMLGGTIASIARILNEE
jgi:hypothetical protein